MHNYLFLQKRIEGCSERTLNYYETTINNMIEKINKKLIALKNRRFKKLFI